MRKGLRMSRSVQHHQILTWVGDFHDAWAEVLGSTAS